MDKKILEGLPLGVSQQILDAIQKIAMPITYNMKTNIWNGFDVILNTTFPLKLDSGTIIDGIMLGANGSRCYLIRSS